jgi:hypothetical protein
VPCSIGLAPSSDELAAPPRWRPDGSIARRSPAVTPAEVKWVAGKVVADFAKVRPRPKNLVRDPSSCSDRKSKQLASEGPFGRFSHQRNKAKNHHHPCSPAQERPGNIVTTSVTAKRVFGDGGNYVRLVEDKRARGPGGMSAFDLPGRGPLDLAHLPGALALGGRCFPRMACWRLVVHVNIRAIRVHPSCVWGPVGRARSRGLGCR